MVDSAKDDFFSRRGSMLAVVMSMTVHLDDCPVDLSILKQHRVSEICFGRAIYSCH